MPDETDRKYEKEQEKKEGVSPNNKTFPAGSNKAQFGHMAQAPQGHRGTLNV